MKSFIFLTLIFVSFLSFGSDELSIQGSNRDALIELQQLFAEENSDEENSDNDSLYLVCLRPGGHRGNMLEVQKIKKEYLKESCYLCLDKLFKNDLELIKLFDCDHWCHKNCMEGYRLDSINSCPYCRDKIKFSEPSRMKVVSEQVALELLKDKSSTELGLPINNSLFKGLIFTRHKLDSSIRNFVDIYDFVQRYHLVFFCLKLGVVVILFVLNQQQVTEPKLLRFYHDLETFVIVFLAGVIISDISSLYMDHGFRKSQAFIRQSLLENSEN
ncbi:MAG: hypothetical protein UR26_C0001G0101 [candidate division TM6 bacterium GW2011_GWF2_32_72]|nr:MAG: hypothetical protein UR26_C0001G0101 [candidate division TM6 bacterium GW2011_GWF2_32_72]